MQVNPDEKSHLNSVIRLSSDQILSEQELITSQEFFTEVFGSFAGIGAIINKHKQIVYVNNDFMNMLGLDGIESIIGNRPGEVLHCVHSVNKTGGCGTTEKCEYCGAHNVIGESQRTGKKVSMEALITSKKDGRYRSLDLNVVSSPITLAGHQFYALTIQDISSEKRRLALERIFFHDLLNSAGGLNGLLSLLREGKSPETERQIIEMSEKASRDIIDEIQYQRQIYAAETGDLQIEIGELNSMNIIDIVIGKIAFHEAGRDKKIRKTEDTADIDFMTDSTILQRVLINLLKNALEATPAGGTVLIGADDLGNRIRFRVQNDTMIPKEIQLQLFQRSFTTKGIGRGLGTYSIRLLTENYLKGNVSFISNEAEGTTFMVDLYKKFR